MLLLRQSLLQTCIAFEPKELPWKSINKLSLSFLVYSISQIHITWLNFLYKKFVWIANFKNFLYFSIDSGGFDRVPLLYCTYRLFQYIKSYGTVTVINFAEPKIQYNIWYGVCYTVTILNSPLL